MIRATKTVDVQRGRILRNCAVQHILPRSVQMFSLGVFCALSLMLIFQNRAAETSIAPAKDREASTENRVENTTRAEETASKPLTSDDLAKYVRWAQQLNINSRNPDRSGMRLSMNDPHDIAMMRDPSQPSPGFNGMPRLPMQ
jgi:hypothetical protein